MKCIIQTEQLISPEERLDKSCYEYLKNKVYLSGVEIAYKKGITSFRAKYDCEQLYNPDRFSLRWAFYCY